MILISLAALALAPSQFGVQMNQYLECVGKGLPADLASRDRPTRTRIYRRAASQCQNERMAAIHAAVEGREPGTSAEAARALAIDIIDTLDPMSGSNR